MTNFEKYREEIERITRLGLDFGLNAKTNEINLCQRMDCTGCKFYDGGCSDEKLKWAYEEYQEPAVDWSKVPIDTKVLVSDDGICWYRRYFAGTNDGEPLVWYDGMTSWSAVLEDNCKPFAHIKLAEEE